MSGEVIRCQCGNWLGVRHPDGRVEVRHRGRRWIGQVDEIVCEHCDEVWRPARQMVLEAASSTT